MCYNSDIKKRYKRWRIRTADRHRKRIHQSILTGIVLTIALAMLVFSLYSLVKVLLEYRKGTDTYNKVEELVLESEFSEETSDAAEGKGEEAPFLDFEGLKEMYEEAEGWILFPDTTISYPVVQGKDNEYYLNHMIDGNVNSAGTLFVEMHNQKGFADQNTIIYGHNMKNGSMFGQLKKYGKEEYYKDHPFFYLYAKDGVWKYEIFSARVVDAAGSSYTIGFGSDKEYQAYIDQAVRRSMYDTGTVVNTSDRIVTLSTCTGRDSDRLIVQAVRGEKVRQQKVCMKQKGAMG